MFEIGYLEDDVPISEARWYANAMWKGTKIIAEEHKSPGAAADDLSRQVLTGGQCQHCERTVLVHVKGEEHLMGFCYWYRQEDRWLWGCAPGAPT